MLAIRNQIDIDIDIDRQQVLRAIGYCDGCEPPVRAVSLVNEYAENVYDLVETSYACAIRDIESVQGSRVFIEDSVTFESEATKKVLDAGISFRRRYLMR